MEETEKAYIAGIIDGEGTVTICMYNQPYKKYPYKKYHRTMIAITNTNKPVLEYIKSFLAGQFLQEK